MGQGAGALQLREPPVLEQCSFFFLVEFCILILIVICLAVGEACAGSDGSGGLRGAVRRAHLWGESCLKNAFLFVSLSPICGSRGEQEQCAAACVKCEMRERGRKLLRLDAATRAGRQAGRWGSVRPTQGHQIVYL